MKTKLEERTERQMSDYESITGMTYRQWLIGMALATTDDAYSTEDKARLAIALADEVIKQIEEESK